MCRLRASGVHILVSVAVLLPLVILIWDFARDQLTANPVREIQLRTGRYALTLLVLSLSCTPIYIVSGFKPVRLLRRPLALYAFMYASLHFLNFIGLDYGFNFPLLWADISQKRFAVVGFAAFLMLLTLAITSTKGWRNRLGKNWKRLHRLVYLAAPLAVFHFLWQAKADFRAPLLYGAIVALLLMIRLLGFSRAVGQRRNQLGK